MVSPDIQAKLDAARRAESTYTPNAQVADSIKDKTLIMFVGPVAIGKSYVMNHLALSDTAFGRVPVFTTRDARPDDEPGMFETQPHSDESLGKLLSDIEAQNVVQYAIHPTTGRVYGSLPRHYAHRYNMLATLSNVVDPMRHLPFSETIVIGLSTHPDTWRTWFEMRYPTASEEKTKRLSEAALSLEWLLHPEHETFVRWVVNSPNNPDATTQDIINIVKYSKQEEAQAKEYARQILELVRNYY
jgi:hypothetical protein